VVLDTLENSEREGTSRQTAMLDDLPLFSAAPAPAPEVQRNPVLDMLMDIHPDELTPKDALDVLYKLKAAAK
jgi:DNA mismatch repair protein MutS